MDVVASQLNLRELSRFKESILNHSWFTRAGYDWHVWPLMKVNRVTSEQVFRKLANSKPFNMGWLDHCTDADSGKAFQTHTCDVSREDDFYIDYWNGIGFKLAIPVDMQKASKETLERPVNYERYSARNDPGFVHRIGELLRESSTVS